MLPLSLINQGENVIIVKVRSKDSEKKHLEDMGFIASERMRVISNHDWDVIVELKGTKITITTEIAAKIFVHIIYDDINQSDKRIVNK